MISKKEARKILSNHTCFTCEKIIEPGVCYYIWASESGKLSIKVPFHKECFKQIAGEKFIFEDY